MNVVRTILSCDISLRKSLGYAGISRKMWYHVKKPRILSLDPLVTRTVQEIGTARPTYGTRRMAAAVSHELKMPVNRKKIRRIFHKLDWIAPARGKKDIIRSAAKNVPRPTAPNRLWQTDMTYI